MIQNNTSEVGSCSRCVTEIQKVKQRSSAVAYFGGLRGEVHWIQAERAQHAFCGGDGRVNAYLETAHRWMEGIQCLAVEGLYVPPQNKRCTLRQRREVRGPDLNAQDLNLYVKCL